MTAEEYRREFVKPALEIEADDQEFLNKVVEIDKKIKKKSKKLELGQSEKDVQARILKRLGLVRNGFFWRENSGMVQQQDKYGKTRMWRAGIKGIADIIGVYKGVFVGIEVKAKGKKPSEYQTAFLRRVRECGGVGFVCDDDTEVLELLKENLHQAKLPIDQH